MWQGQGARAAHKSSKVVSEQQQQQSTQSTRRAGAVALQLHAAVVVL
jgi:hypothetical protein